MAAQRLRIQRYLDLLVPERCLIFSTSPSFTTTAEWQHEKCGAYPKKTWSCLRVEISNDNCNPGSSNPKSAPAHLRWYGATFREDAFSPGDLPGWSSFHTNCDKLFSRQHLLHYTHFSAILFLFFFRFGVSKSGIGKVGDVCKVTPAWSFQL